MVVALFLPIPLLGLPKLYSSVAKIQNQNYTFLKTMRNSLRLLTKTLI